MLDIAVAISEIVKLWKLPATRNNATADSNARASGASIVREAIEKGANIHLTEAAINKIWLTRSSEELATNE